MKTRDFIQMWGVESFFVQFFRNQRESDRFLLVFLPAKNLVFYFVLAFCVVAKKTYQVTGSGQEREKTIHE